MEFKKINFWTIIFLFLLNCSAVEAQRPIDTTEDPDMPSFTGNTMTKEQFLTLRAEAIAKFRGIEKDKPFDPQFRINAIRKMEDQQRQLALSPNGFLAAWTELGPMPIPNGQVVSGSQLPVQTKPSISYS